MSLVSTRLEPTAAPSDLPLRRFSVHDYHRMIESGILSSDHSVELLEGWIVESKPQSPLHASVIRRLESLLRKMLPEDLLLSTQLPITLTTSEPEPEFTIVRGPLDRYDECHPGRGDVLLAIEVSAESLRKDRETKARIYASAGIPEYWFINVGERIVEVMSEPRPCGLGRYKRTQRLERTDTLDLVVHGKKIAAIPLRDILK